MEEALIHGLTNFGAPTAICFFLLFRVEHKIDELSAVITKLSDAVVQLRVDQQHLLRGDRQ